MALRLAQLACSVEVELPTNRLVWPRKWPFGWPMMVAQVTLVAHVRGIVQRAQLTDLGAGSDSNRAYSVEATTPLVVSLHAWLNSIQRNECDPVLAAVPQIVVRRIYLSSQSSGASRAGYRVHRPDKNDNL
jgi:hypothetical protein